MQTLSVVCFLYDSYRRGSYRFAGKELMRKAEEWTVFFEDNRRFADLINGIGCGGKQFVKETDLSEEDVTSGRKNRDMLRKVAFGVNFVIVGVEHQEKNDYEMPFRTMCYDVSRYQKQMRQIKKKNRTNKKGLKAEEYMYGFKKDDKIKPVITFILYAGEEQWDGPHNLCDMMDFTDVPDELRTMVSDYRINVIPIHKFEKTEVFQTDVRQVFNFIRCSTDKKKLLELVENDVYYNQMDDDAYELITKYTNSKELVRKEEYKTAEGKNDVCKAIQDLMADSRLEGIEEGIEQGIEQEARLNARSFFVNGASFELVRNSIKGISDEQLQEIYDEVMVEMNK